MEMFKKLFDSKTKITAILFAVYNVAIAFYPILGEVINPDMLNTTAGALMVWFLRDGMIKTETSADKTKK